MACAAAVLAVPACGSEGSRRGTSSGGWHGSLRRTRPTVEPTNTDPAVTISPNPASVGQFGPGALAISPGTRVQWNNWSQTEHTVTFDNPLVPSSQPFGGGGSFLVRFPTRGTFTYHCRIHAGMTGRIVVA